MPRQARVRLSPSSLQDFFLLTNCLFLAGLLSSYDLSPSSYLAYCFWAPVAEATSCHSLRRLHQGRLVSCDSPFTGELHEIKRLALFSPSPFSSRTAILSHSNFFSSVFTSRHLRRFTASSLLPSSRFVAGPSTVDDYRRSSL